MREVWLLFYKWINWSLETLSRLLRITQTIKGRTKHQILGSLSLKTQLLSMGGSASWTSMSLTGDHDGHRGPATLALNRPLGWSQLGESPSWQVETGTTGIRGSVECGGRNEDTGSRVVRQIDKQAQNSTTWTVIRGSKLWWAKQESGCLSAGKEVGGKDSGGLTSGQSWHRFGWQACSVVGVQGVKRASL